MNHSSFFHTWNSLHDYLGWSMWEAVTEKGLKNLFIVRRMITGCQVSASSLSSLGKLLMERRVQEEAGEAALLSLLLFLLITPTFTNCSFVFSACLF